MKTARALALLMLLAACRSEQSVLAPRGPAASRLANLGSAVMITFSVVAVIMFALILWAVLRERGTLEEHEPADAGGGVSWILIGGFAIPTVILAVFFIATLQTMAAFPLRDHTPAAGEVHSPDIVVTAHQWWWQAEYVGEALCRPAGSNDPALPYRMTTANELHIPIGLPVEIALRSVDVIHSFWIPQLHGKVDVVPGQENRIRIVASRPGRYPGQCAEYCGEQHAKMLLTIVAEQPEQFTQWMNEQRAPARQPVTIAEKHGRDLFEGRACVLCHTIRGTGANATIGPDLSHLASRATIASGAYPNNDAYLSAWVTHAQSLKPGAEMPDLTVLDGPQLHDLVAYLRSLR